MKAFIDEHRDAYGVVLRQAQDEADLQGAADRPVDVPCPCRTACRSEPGYRHGPGATLR